MASYSKVLRRLRTLAAKIKGKIKGGSKEIAYGHLGLTLKENIFQLAQDQCLANAAQALDVFGHTTLRGILSELEVAAIAGGLVNLEAGLDSDQSVITIDPVEKSRQIQNVFFDPNLLSILKKVLPPFWFYGSDACVGIPEFSKHRDAFFRPPFYKIFIPLAPGTFYILPGSHHAGDIYARKVGAYASTWDNGAEPSMPVSEVHFTKYTKTVRDVSCLATEKLFLHKHLRPGDVFIFNQSAVHGLKSQGAKNFFLAVTVVPAPTVASAYGFSRTEHVDRVIANIVSSSAAEWHLSKAKRVSPEECLFTGYKFSDDDLARLTSQSEWNDCFGLRFIEQEKWKQAFDANKYLAFQRLQDDL